MRKPTYIAFIKGSYSKPMATVEEARDWLNKQLDQKVSVDEGFIYESIERIYKKTPSLESEKISAQADQSSLPFADKGDHSYSNEKPVARTHTGEIGAGYESPSALTNGG